MSEPVVVILPHKLGKEEALRRVRPALSKASDSFPILKVEQEVWSGDRMDFRVQAMGQMAAGNIQVGDTQVRLEVTLPWLLHKFAEVGTENHCRERSGSPRKEMTRLGRGTLFTNSTRRLAVPPGNDGRVRGLLRRQIVDALIIWSRRQVACQQSA